MVAVHREESGRSSVPRLRTRMASLVADRCAVLSWEHLGGVDRPVQAMPPIWPHALARTVMFTRGTPLRCERSISS